MSKVVLITGCSTGIGRDLAEWLAQCGYLVVATARKSETLESLPAALKLPLDVTRPASVQQAVERTLQQFGRIDVLVNNAGFAVRGAIEEVPDEQVQQIFDVNVFGALRMVRAVVPHMRQQGSGRIINISSIVGRPAFPINGVYASTKLALEALNDALRLEVADFGIQVVSVEPGAIKTPFDATARIHAQAILSNPASPYHNLYQAFMRFMDDTRRRTVGPRVVSEAVQKAIEAPRPKAHYPVAVGFSLRLFRVLGDSAGEFLLKRMLR